MSKTKTYNNYVYGFDIETTTFEYQGKNYSDVYLGSFVKMPFNLALSKEDVEGLNTIYVRSWNDINTMLVKINTEAKQDEAITVIYVHNLSYEFDGLIKNCPFVYDNFSNDNALFVKSRKPCVITLDNIELRCTYLLTGKSLKALGKQYNYPKLEIDYNSQYFSFSELPEEEYVYNERDVKLMLYALLQECKKFPYIKTVSDIPYTLTGLTRQMNKIINTKEANQEFTKRNVFQRYKDKDYVEYMQQVYTGGYTHANVYTVGKCLKDIVSIDIVSSYPTSMLYREYPYNFKECQKDKMFFFNWLLKHNSGNYEDKIINYKRPFVYSFFATVVLKNVKIKLFNNCVTFPVISASKCIGDVTRYINDNGRVAAGDLIKIAVTEVDFWLIQQFYDFELVDVEQLFYTRSHRQLSDFSINCVLKYADEKSVLKSIKEGFEHDKNFKLLKEHFYCERSKDYIFSIEEITALLYLSQKDQEQMITILLSNAKSKLNAQYGIQVQKLFQENYLYTKENDIYEKEIDYNLPRTLYRNFEEGLYITAYSRLTLFTMALKLCNNNCIPIYSDTDSWKIQGNYDIIKKVVDDYNAQVEEILNCSKLYNIGYYDLEKKYDYFCTWGCKKYIVAVGEEIQCTIAGVPKIAISEAMTELYKLYDFDFQYLCNIVFKPNSIYQASLTDKLSTKYKQEFFKGEVKDDYGNIGFISFNSIVELVPTDYVLLDTKHQFLNYNYIKYVEYIQNRKIDINSYSILKKENGQILVDYVSTFNEFVLENLDTKDCEV